MLLKVCVRIRTRAFEVESAYESIPNAFLPLSFLNGEDSDGSGNKRVGILRRDHYQHPARSMNHSAAS